jgi:2-dehydro-3-deoxy-D-arabinonate dehydratase
MILTRHQTEPGPRWACDGHFLPPGYNLLSLLEKNRATMLDWLSTLPRHEPAKGDFLPPLDHRHEVWAAGVTYLRSRDARRAESSAANVYDKVYDAARPELFFKSIGWRVAGHGMPIRIRRDSGWNVPEPELTVVINRHGEIVGYTAGDDVSSRDIEGENPLYLPQAKVYNGSCALGPGIVLASADQMATLPVHLEIVRSGATAFQGETSIARMKRPLQELADYLVRELDFPHGAFLMTGTGIVPGEEFSLQIGDVVRVAVGAVSLENQVQ